jgi:negative regulator of flagellin synthesis FlgM
MAARGASAANGRPALRAVGSDRGQDEVALSGAATRMRELCRMIADMPDVRPDRLAEVMDAINSGEYDPSATEVAEKMLGRIIADRLR